MKIKFSLLIFALALQLACLSMPLPGLFSPTPTPFFEPATPTLSPQPGVSPAPTETPALSKVEGQVRLFQQVTLIEKSYSETGAAPLYTLEITTPLLEGRVDSRALEFNRQSEALVAELVAGFKAGFVYLTVEPIAAGSFFQVTFTQLAPPGDVLSLAFAVDGYADGAAHPYHFTQTLNFDLETGQALGLETLFLPNSNYLTVLSAFCRAELGLRDIGFDPAFTTGADPLPENYKNWNLTSEGLLISFDEYQVAAYAAGMQQVIIPYAELSAILDPGGPVAKILDQIP
jgi:hypothetical protein